MNKRTSHTHETNREICSRIRESIPIHDYAASRGFQIIKKGSFYSIKGKPKNPYSFLEKSKCMIVCGATPSEIDYSTAALSLFQSNENIVYLFNFVPKADETDIAALMGGHKVFFSPLIPDMFTVLNEQQNLYNRIIEPDTVSSENKKHKKGLFFRRNT